MELEKIIEKLKKVGKDEVLVLVNDYFVQIKIVKEEEEDIIFEAESKKVKDPSSPATREQIKAIKTIAKDMGWTREQLHKKISKFLGRKVESCNELTKGEASDVIDWLKSLPEYKPRT